MRTASVFTPHSTSQHSNGESIAPCDFCRNANFSACSGRVPMSEMVGLDYLYVANWSLWADLKLLVRTVPYVLGRSGM